MAIFRNNLIRRLYMSLGPILLNNEPKSLFYVILRLELFKRRKIFLGIVIKIYD